MFEKEIEFIYKYNLNKIKQLGSFITYEQLISTNIHPALLQYLSAEIDFLIYEDRQKLLKDSLFDYSGDKIIEHFASIGEEIKRTKKFSYEYLSKLLLHASSFNANFVIRPKWSLMQFVFENDDESEKQIVEIKQILNYLHYYPYLKRLLINFFNKKRLITISSSDFKDLLDKIDKINFETNFEKVLDSALITIAEFIYIGEVQNKKVSRQFLELFLEDKGLSHLSTALYEKYGGSSIEKYNIMELKSVVLNFNHDEEVQEVDVYDKLEDFHDSIENETVVEDETEAVLETDSNLTQDSELEVSLSNNEENVIDNKESDFIENDIDPEPEELNIVNESTVREEKKSFLETHIENLEEEVEIAELENPITQEEETKEDDELIEDINEELEPPELDEAPRDDDKEIGKIFDLVSEEEKIDSFVEDTDENLQRIEIEDDDEIPFADNDNKDLPETTEIEDDVVTVSDGFIKEGTSVTFHSDELIPVSEKDNKNTTDEEIDDWPTESTSSLSNESYFDEDTILEDTSEEPDEKSEEAIEYEDNSDTKNDQNSKSISEEKDNQQTLFEEEELSSLSNIDENIDEDDNLEDESVPPVTEKNIDISSLLENKKITKIIEVVFDYDMEEFANSIDRISECQGAEEAHKLIDEIVQKEFIDPSIKEVKMFKNIISKYFK